MKKSEQIAAINERNKLKDSQISDLKDEINMRVKERELANQKYLVYTFDYIFLEREKSNRQR